MAAVSDQPVLFYQYSLLPAELRMFIVECFVEEGKHSRLSAHTHHTLKRSKLACLDRAWKKVIERDNFEHLRLDPLSVDAFERICVGPRQAYVRTIMFRRADAGYVEGARRSRGEVVLAAFKKLFEALRPWPARAARSGPPPLVLGFRFGQDGGGPPVACDFSDLPVVPAIGRISYCWKSNATNDFLVSLLSRTCCVSSFYMNFWLDYEDPASYLIAERAILNLHAQYDAHHPNLKDLELRGWRGGTGGTWPPVSVTGYAAALLSLTKAVFNLSCRLEKVVLGSVVDMAEFFRISSQAAAADRSRSGPAWPGLRELKMEGGVDLMDDSLAVKHHAADGFFLAVTESLSQMPRLAFLDVNVLYFWHLLTDEIVRGADVRGHRIQFARSPDPVSFADWPSECTIHEDHLDCQPSEKSARLIVSRFMLTPDTVQLWKDFLGSAELQVYRVRGTRTAEYFGCWSGQSVEDQKEFDR